MNLNDLAKQYKTDKSSDYHNYASKYEKYFDEVKNKKINILEIGVLLGSSLKMWENYFSDAQLFAIDIEPSCKSLETSRTKIFIGDQSDISFLSENFENLNFDIIIDDGSHVPKHQITSFEYLFKRLNPGGIYVIEDLHTSYCNHPKFSSDKLNFISYLSERIHDLQLNGKDSQEWSYGCKKNHLDVVGWDKLETFNYFEKWIEFIHVYKSICFIKKEIW